MNIKWIWSDENRCLHQEYSGTQSVSEIIEDTLKLHASPKFSSLHCLIEDYTNTTRTPFSSSEVVEFNEFVRMRAQTKSDLKVAIVSRNSPDAIAAAENYCEQMKTSRYQYHAFQCLEDAQVWFASE